MHYKPKTFDIPQLKGISAKNIEEHLKLYEGYVKHTNLILEQLEKGAPSDDPAYAYGRSEMHRRFSFEYNGMKNHEYYFSSLEDGAQAPDTESALYKKIEEQFGSFDEWLAGFKKLATTRGVGWAILYYDRDEGRLLNVWIDEQHLGHLNSCQYVVGIDMWEHAFVADYHPSGKGQYVDDYFANVNWKKPEELFGGAGD